ncbi:hypothetical protein C8R43DRAFT_1131577 [Mycena crocata]|nr:hypothetical protein C8R43DRAFT_1131577 [Mycena crocata]
MPTTSSTTSLIAGGGDDLDDDSCLRLIPRPTTLSSSSPMFRSKSPASRGSLPSDVVLAVSGSTDALGALSAESADFGLVGPSLARHDTPTTRWPASAVHFGSSGAQGFLVLVWHPRSSFPTVELGLTRFPRLAPLKTPTPAHYLALAARWRVLDQTMSGELCSLIRTFVHFMRNPAAPDTIPTPCPWELGSVRSSDSESLVELLDFVCIVGLTSSPSRSCTQLTLKRSGGLWLLNSNLGSKLLASENLDYELGDRPQEPLIIFKFWTPFRCSKPTLHFHRRDYLQFWKGHHTHLTYCDGRRLGLLRSKSYFMAVTIFKLSHGPLPRFNWLPFQRPTISSIMWWSYCIYKCMTTDTSKAETMDFEFQVGWSLKRLNSCLEVQVKLVAFLDTGIGMERHINQACDRALLVRNHDHLLKHI